MSNYMVYFVLFVRFERYALKVNLCSCFDVMTYLVPASFNKKSAEESDGEKKIGGIKVKGSKYLI